MQKWNFFDFFYVLAPYTPSLLTPYTSIETGSLAIPGGNLTLENRPALIQWKVRPHFGVSQIICNFADLLQHKMAFSTEKRSAMLWNGCCFWTDKTVMSRDLDLR